MSNIKIYNLKEVEGFADIIADRIWTAWWKEKGYALDDINGLVQASIVSLQVPFAHVAVDGNTFVGTASLIECDLSDRANLMPWIAALWIEPNYRLQGHARALLENITNTGFEMGFPILYLCAKPELATFYKHCGWTMLEMDVGPHKLSVFSKTRGSRTS